MSLPTQQKIILASQSPRRSFLLKQAGFDFEIHPNDVDESYPADLPLEEVAPFLAQKKANAAQALLDDHSIILASDSIVLVDDQILGKPIDEEDAKNMLRCISGRMHLVITGVCLLSKTKEKVFSETAKVYFDPLTDEEIDFYVTQYQPLDKAGAYAIQEWIGLCKINKIEGTYSNIMGLPMNSVFKALANWPN